MKKLYFLIILLTYFFGTAQCPAPTNLVVSGVTGTGVQLSWTESGTATQWEIAIIPDYVIGISQPTVGAITSSNPFAITGLTPGMCYVFYVRSICSSTDLSSWTAIAYTGCSAIVYNYIATLSNNNTFSNIDNKEITIYPNPTQKTLQLQTKTDNTIDKIIITDLSGKIILVQTQNTNQINVEQLSSGMYFMEAFSGEEKFTSKFIKE
jgi:hypothetical protein